MKPIILIGLVLLTSAMVWYSQIPVHGSYATDLLPGYLMVGVGIAFSFVPISDRRARGRGGTRGGPRLGPDQHVTADRRCDRDRRRLDRLHDAITRTCSPTDARKPDALTHGFGYGFWALAFFGLAAIIAAVTLIRREEMAETPATAPIA